MDDLTLGGMQPVLGRPSDTFGYAGGSAPSPVVDVLAREANQQVRLLAPGATLSGVSLNASAANLQADAAAVARKPVPQAPSRDVAAAAKPETGGSFLSRPVDAAKRLFQSNPSPAAGAAPP